MLTTFFSITAAAADFKLYDFSENIDVQFLCDLDGNGKEDSFYVDSYRNYVQSFLFYINGAHFVFDSSWKGSYSDFAIIDLDETDSFKEIFVFFSHKIDWFNIYRYDGGRLLQNVVVMELPESENDDPISISAGGGELCVKRGEEVFVYNSFEFEEAQLMSERWDGEEGQYDDYPVEFNGERILFDQLPVNKKDRILVPIRAIFEKMGYGVEWDAATQTAYAKKGENWISVQIGSKQIHYTTDGVSGIYECDVAPLIVGGRTLIPLRGVAECAGCTVLWEDGVARITTD